MKNIKYILSFLVTAAFVFTSCEEEELYPRFGEIDGQSSVAFTSGSYDVSESTTTSFADGTTSPSNSVATITLRRRSADISSPLTVSLEYTATYLADNDFVSAGEDASDAIEIKTNLEEVTFEANSATTSFNVTTIDDVLPAGDINVLFEISSVSDNKYQIGEQSGNSLSSTTLTVVDDDCPIDLTVWEGEYEFTVVGADYNASFGGEDLADLGVSYDGTATLVADSTDALGITAILTGPEFGSPYAFEFVTCPLRTEVVTPMTSFIGSTAWNMQQGEVRGTFNPDSKEINIIGTLGTNGDFVIQLEKVETE